MSYEDQLGALAARLREANDRIDTLQQGLVVEQARLFDLQARHSEFYAEILSRIYKLELAGRSYGMVGQNDTRDTRSSTDDTPATLFAGTVRAGSYDFSQGSCPPDAGSTQGHHGGRSGTEEGDTHEGSEA